MIKDLPSIKAVNLLPTAQDYIKERMPKKIKKIIITDKGELFYVKENEKNFHTRYGIIDINKKQQKIQEETYHIIDPTFIDHYKRILRVAQMVPLKDIGIIITETGINRESQIVEAGAGSGGITCFLAGIAKKVTSYEIREDNYDVVRKNIDYLEIKNVVLKNKDVKKADEKEQDVVILDMPDPWTALASAKKMLKRGGFLVTYLPCITQVDETVRKMEGFIHMKTIEIIEREWHVEGLKVRPKSQGLMHSGFITIARKK